MGKHRLTHSVKCPFCRFETIHEDQLELIAFPTHYNNNKEDGIPEKTAPHFVIGHCINDTIIDENEDEENFAYLNIDVNGVIVRKEDARLFSEAARFMEELP